MRQLTITIIFLMIITYGYAQEEEYIKMDMPLILKETIEVANEHITDSYLDEVEYFQTHFYGKKYITYYRWEVTDHFTVPSDDLFKFIEYDLRTIKMPENRYPLYKNILWLSLGEYKTILVFSDDLKADFLEWVKVGDTVEFYLMLTSYESKSKTAIFYVRKYYV